MEFQTELKKLGLTDKEAAVYIGALELGPSPVQQIARKAKVVRATTYVILESLLHKGLISTFKKGKKTLFTAEPPNQLLRLLEKQEEEIRHKERDIEKILPALQILMKAGDEKPTIRYFEGREGLNVLRQEIYMYCRSKDTIYNFTPMDHLNAVFPQETDVGNRQRVAKAIYSKTIFTTKSSTLLKLLLSKPHAALSERLYVPPEYFPVPCGMTIFRDRIAIGTLTGKMGAVIIESEPMTRMMLALFELAWRGGKELGKHPVDQVDK